MILLTHSCGRRKNINIFPKGISPKANVIVLVELEFEIIYFETAIQHLNHYVMGTPTKVKSEDKFS